MSSLFLPPPPPDLLIRASLFIDFDGTLVELIDRPEAVVIDQPLRDLLGRVGEAMPGRVAIVSGRSIDQIDHFLGDQARMMAVGGSHGVERRAIGGAMSVPENMPDLGPAAAALADFAAAHPGTIVEPKRYGIALHYRTVPEVEEKAREIVRGLAETFGFGVQTGKMMVELKIADGDKGQAVAAFLREPSMADTRPWFIGDDVTDEAGFVVAGKLGGGGIFVGPPRETAAIYALPDVAAVRAWLAEAIITAA
jgi:trehalose 6-phosphate phosphatase